jgi:hypothetical protein
MTYDELLSTIQSYTIRDDAPIEGFIKRAETYLRTIVRHYLSEQVVSLPVVDKVAALPDDFREMRAITGTKTYKPVSPTNARLNCNEVGYYHSGNTLVFVGEPDETVELLYAAAFGDLSADSTNWLFSRFSGVYVAAILKEFYRWEKDAEGVAIEDAALKEALSIVAEDDRRGRQTPIVMDVTTW